MIEEKEDKGTNFSTNLTIPLCTFSLNSPLLYPYSVFLNELRH